MGMNKSEWIKKFSSEIKAAAVKDKQIRSASVAQALNKSTSSVNLSTKLKEVFGTVEKLEYTSPKSAVSESYKIDIYNGIDEELKLKPGTVQKIKKGSIEESLNYDQMVLSLSESITFES